MLGEGKLCYVSLQLNNKMPSMVFPAAMKVYFNKHVTLVINYE